MIVFVEIEFYGSVIRVCLLDKSHSETIRTGNSHIFDFEATLVNIWSGEHLYLGIDDVSFSIKKSLKFRRSSCCGVTIVVLVLPV